MEKENFSTKELTIAFIQLTLMIGGALMLITIIENL